MKPYQSREKIEEMRRRLYDRGSAISQTKRHKLTDEPIDVARNWDVVDKTKSTATPENPNQPEPSASKPPTKKTTRRKRYRVIALMASLLLFLVITAVSAGLFFFGGNQISGGNIDFELSGPQFISGGETVDLAFTIQNNNDVTLKSPTLIVNYPPGTRSTGDNPRNLFEERISLDDLSPDEVINHTVQVAVFGEEGVRREVSATIEYRVDGSNGTFYKEATPISFGISSSPLVLRVDNEKEVASGQEVTMEVEVVSNSDEVLNDIVIEAAYPSGFRYTGADPEPGSGQNVWLIEELSPEDSTSISITGVITGQTEESLQVNFNSGPANSDNRYSIGANLTQTTAEFMIARPFIEVDVSVSGQGGQNIVLDQGEISDVEINILNTLDEAVYDLMVEVIPGGNALNEDSIRSENGYFDSDTDTFRWEASDNESFETFEPGEEEQLEFEVVPNDNQSTASYNLVVNVYAKRSDEDSASEILVGTQSLEARYSSEVIMGSQANLVSGPVPPTVGETTTYSIDLVAEAGANDITGALVETGLPDHVDWNDNYSGDGELEYNSSSREIRWDIGNIDAGERKEMVIEVDFTPNSSQVRDTPVLINAQRLQANDRYTSQLLQDSAPVVTTELSTEFGFDEDNGEVER